VRQRQFVHNFILGWNHSLELLGIGIAMLLQ
jgi:hypothetical protein